LCRACLCRACLCRACLCRACLCRACGSRRSAGPSPGRASDRRARAGTLPRWRSCRRRGVFRSCALTSPTMSSGQESR
jgi:hypothetical protein